MLKLKKLLLFILSHFFFISAAFGSCGDVLGLFNSEKPFENPQVLYELLLTKQNGQESAEFKLGKEFLPLLTRMLAELNTLRSAASSAAHLEAIDQVEAKIQKVIAVDIPYLNYVSISLDFVRLVEFVNSGPRGRWDSSSVSVDHDVQAALDRGAFYIPSFDNPTLSQFIRMKGVPVYSIAVTLQNQFADGYEMGPVSFFYHDINHSRSMSTQDFLMFENLNFEKKIDLANRLTVFLERMVTEIGSLSEKKLIRLFIFSWLHENSGLNILDFLDPDRTLPLPEAQAGEFLRRELDIPLSPDTKTHLRRADQTFNQWRSRFIEKNRDEIRGLIDLSSGAK